MTSWSETEMLFSLQQSGNIDFSWGRLEINRELITTPVDRSYPFTMSPPSPEDQFNEAMEFLQSGD